MAFRCPICRKPVEPPDDQDGRDRAKHSYFPFCSDRCKLIDLGRWLDDKYQIPVVGEDSAETNNPGIDTRET